MGEQLNKYTYTFNYTSNDERAGYDNKNNTDQTADLSIGGALSCWILIFLNDGKSNVEFDDLIEKKSQEKAEKRISYNVSSATLVSLQWCIFLNGK